MTASKVIFLVFNLNEYVNIMIDAYNKSYFEFGVECNRYYMNHGY